MSDAQKGQSGQAAQSESLARRLLSNPWVGFVLAVVVIGLDQYTKALATQGCNIACPLRSRLGSISCLLTTLAQRLVSWRAPVVATMVSRWCSAGCERC